MRNRYGDEYRFNQVSDNTFMIEGDLKHWRFGGKEGQERIDDNDLGFVDPSGGPFIMVGHYRINGRTVNRIYVEEDAVMFDVE